MPVHIADDPLSCVARGAGRMVEEFANTKYRQILERSQNSGRLRVAESRFGRR